MHCSLCFCSPKIVGELTISSMYGSSPPYSRSFLALFGIFSSERSWLCGVETNQPQDLPYDVLKPDTVCLDHLSLDRQPADSFLFIVHAVLYCTYTWLIFSLSPFSSRTVIGRFLKENCWFGGEGGGVSQNQRAGAREINMHAQARPYVVRD